MFLIRAFLTNYPFSWVGANKLSFEFHQQAGPMDFEPGKGLTRVRLVFYPIVGFLCDAARMFKEIQDQKLLDLDGENGLAEH